MGAKRRDLLDYDIRREGIAVHAADGEQIGRLVHFRHRKNAHRALRGRPADRVRSVSEACNDDESQAARNAVLGDGACETRLACTWPGMKEV